MYGAGADLIWSEPESAPEPRTSGAGAAQKRGGSATLTAKIRPKPEFVRSHLNLNLL